MTAPGTVTGEPALESAVTAALVAYRNKRIASPVLVKSIIRIAGRISWESGRRDLADDLAQEFWLIIDKVVERFDPNFGSGEAYIAGCLRKIGMATSRKNPVPMENNEEVEDIHVSTTAAACFVDSLDRKLAIDAIQRKLLKGDTVHLSPLPFVRQEKGGAEQLSGQEPEVNLLLGEKPKKEKKVGRNKNPDHLRIKEIRLSLDMTQNEFSSSIGLIPATLVSYEQGQTQKVPADVMLRAEEMMSREGEVLEWRQRFDHQTMISILDDWAKELGADPTDLPTMAALTGTVTSTVSRWRNNECRPSLREIVAYNKNVKINAARLRKSGLLIDTNKLVTE